MLYSSLRLIKTILFQIVVISYLTGLFLHSPAFADNEKTIALVMKALSNPFFSKMEFGAKQYAERKKIALEVFGVERETDVDHQIGIVENLISRGYGAIVIAPVDSKLLIPVCQKAIENNINVINIDNPFHKETLDSLGISIPFVGPDNEKGADRIGEYIKRKLNGQGNVAIIEGIRGVENAELRKKGFIEAVTRESKIEVVASESANWHSDEALTKAMSIFEKHMDIDAVFCANDKMSLGVLQALDILGLAGKILLAGYDNLESVRHEMQNSRIHATIEQHPELMGRIGVALAARSLKGDHLPQYVPTKVDLITYETFNKKIALSISDLKNPFFLSLSNSAMETARLHGFKLMVADAKNNNAQQLTDLLNFLNHGIDALIINPTNTETVEPGILIANRKDVPVTTVDRKAGGGRTICHIESDNLEGGKIAARLMAHHLSGSGKIVELEGIPGTSAAQERGAGFNQELLRWTEIKVVARKVAGFDRKRAANVIGRLIKRGFEFDGIFAHNDSMILGAMDALESSHGSNNKVLIGFDGIEEAVNAIRQGRITGSIAQKPGKMGVLAVQSMAAFFRGEPVLPNILVDLDKL
jgi:ABC-type sugar transport system substrate-binding protein